MCARSCVQPLDCVWLFVILWTVDVRLPYPWDLPGKNTGESCYVLLQGIFLIQDQTCVSCVGRRILYQWATWKPYQTHDLQISSLIFSLSSWYPLKRNFLLILKVFFFLLSFVASIVFKKSFVKCKGKDSLIFSSKTFIVLSLQCMSMIQFELVLYMWLSSCPSTFCWKHSSLPMTWKSIDHCWLKK